MNNNLRVAYDMTREIFTNQPQLATLEEAAQQWVDSHIPARGGYEPVARNYCNAVRERSDIILGDLGELKTPTWFEFDRMVTVRAIAALLRRDPELALEELRRI